MARSGDAAGLGCGNNARARHGGRRVAAHGHGPGWRVPRGGRAARPAGTRMIGIVVADDHEVVRARFAAMLGTQPDFTVLGTAGGGAEAVRACRELRPDVVLMDIRMPGTDGIEATRQLTLDDRAPRVLILTTFDLDEYVFDALRAGASGFLLKEVTAGQLYEPVRVIAAGDALLAPGVPRRLLTKFPRIRPP